MESAKLNVFGINIHPENWEDCLKDHRFGIRVDARHPKFNKGDIFLVRKTGKDYGVMGIWVLKEEKYVTTQDEVPWEDSDYRWQQWFEPIVDFQTPVSEEFAGATKFSSKIRIAAARLIGSVVILYEPEIARYLELILEEKAEECSAEVVYQGEKLKVVHVDNALVY